MLKIFAFVLALNIVVGNDTNETEVAVEET